MNSARVQPLSLSNRPSQERAWSATATTGATTQVRDPHWGLFTVLTVGVFVFLLRPITGNMAGIAIEPRAVAVNIARLPEVA
jgi:hypothetical protein